MKTAPSLNVASSSSPVAPKATRVMPSGRQVAALVAAATLSLFGLAAQAQSSDAPKTREQVRADRASAPYDNDALKLGEVRDEGYAVRRDRRPDCTHCTSSEKEPMSKVRWKESWGTYRAGRMRRGG